MDPRAFVKISISGLGVKVPALVPKAGAGGAASARTGVHPSASPFFCEVRLPTFPVQTVPVPLISAPPRNRHIAATFYLDEPALEKLLLPSCFFKSSFPCLEVVVYTGRQGSKFGVKEGKTIGTFSLPVSSQWLEGKPVQLHSGWVPLNRDGGSSSKQALELHLNVKAEADPRYIFQFDGDTACSPQVVQIQGNITQPLFSCKFSRDRLSRSRLGLCDTPRSSGGCLSSDKERVIKERKGWLIMIHDLSGSPVAAASIVTPFVPSAGTDRVSRSNPGAWLILRPDSSSAGSWEPWGRLKAWRERGKRGGLGLRLELSEGGAGLGAGVLVSETVIRGGGEFSIDTLKSPPAAAAAATGSTLVESPSSSGDCSFVGYPASGGFVMSCSARNSSSSGSSSSNRNRNSPLVQLGMRHVTCAEDAAVFVALAAAVDLSADACQPFSSRLRKELLLLR